jgi:chitin synthase
MDGDVDFGPDSVRMLVDRMKKNKKVGAACGRVHPIGAGPMIWFQKMEYALSYWLQKTTEHSLGCVLCAPGCFSMFRASALMDDNVMRLFAQKPEDPDDHILHDLGEDRWLSRLLIEQGYKIEYCAASDAYTHAPETITEYFNQRRRWIPSTLGNTVCFLKNYRRTIRVNENVSFLCILYHICFLASYILSPATITIAIADAFNATTDIDMWGSFILACLPAVVFLIVCYQDWKEEIKIGFAAMLGTYYSILMMIVVVGTIVRVVDGSWKTTAVLFLVIMAVIFFLTAICHPFELSCVKPCFLFFLCIPTSYILIIIYSLTTMNQCTWGTRDNVFVPQKRRKVNLDENEVKELEKQLTDAKASNELINKIEELLENGASNSNDELLLQILAALERIEMKEAIDKQLENGVDVEKLIETQYNSELIQAAQYGSALAAFNAHKAENDEASNMYWLTKEEMLKFSDIRMLDDEEIVFWKKLIKKYLIVEKLEPPQKHKLQLGLNDMRDRGVFAFFMLNALWIAFVFPILLAQDRLKDMLYIPIPIPSLYYQPVLIEPLGVLHLGFFAFISLTQFIAMLCHRYNTFQHILASTKLRSNIHEGMRIEDIIDTVKMLQQIKVCFFIDLFLRVILVLLKKYEDIFFLFFMYLEKK